MQHRHYILIQLTPKKWGIARRFIGPTGRWRAYRVVATAATEHDAKTLLDALTSETTHAAEA